MSAGPAPAPSGIEQMPLILILTPLLCAVALVALALQRAWILVA